VQPPATRRVFPAAAATIRSAMVAMTARWRAVVASVSMVSGCLREPSASAFLVGSLQRRRVEGGPDTVRAGDRGRRAAHRVWDVRPAYRVPIGQRPRRPLRGAASAKIAVSNKPAAPSTRVRGVRARRRGVGPGRTPA
jgi:hypothetical protein